MKKYFVKINGSEKVSEIEILDNHTFRYKGTEYEYDFKNLSDSMTVLRVNGSNYITKTEKDTESEEDHADITFNVDLNSETYKVICKSEFDILTEKFAKGKSDSKFKNDILSPMPGAIVKLNVKDGAHVKKGDVFLVLEAMKMENEIKAVRDCIVKKVFVEEKNSVDKGQLLIKLESPETNS